MPVNAAQIHFKTLTYTEQMEEAQKYYLKRVSTPKPQSAQPGKRGALRTYASSPDMSLPLVQLPAQLSRASSQAHQHHRHQHVQWRAQDRQQLNMPAAHPAAMRSLETDLPSMFESSAGPEAAAPAGAQEAASGPRHAQTPAPPSVMHTHTKSCLKHAGVGKSSPPQAREQLEIAADNMSLPGLTPVFELAFSDANQSQFPAEEASRRQSSSSEYSVPEHSVPEQWPETCSWTVPCHVFKYRTVTFSFTDPSLPVVLRPAINVSFSLRNI